MKSGKGDVQSTQRLPTAREAFYVTIYFFLFLGSLLAVSVVSTEQAITTRQLPLRVTVRHFLPSGCMRPNEINSYWFGDATTTALNYQWINDSARCPIRNDILDGIYSGHPDFETPAAATGQGCSGTPGSLSQDTTMTNVTLYFGGVSCAFLYPAAWAGVYPANMTRIVENSLSFGGDGLPKPTYCTAGPYLHVNDSRCGWVVNPQTKQPQTATSGPRTYSQWYSDDALYSRRVSFTLSLSETMPLSGVYAYFSDNYHPLDEFQSCNVTRDQRLDCSNGGEIWPRSIKGPPTSPLDEHKSGIFSFTTEIHTFFTFQGNETLEFSGDDDVWIFINERLALDVGGLHPPARSAVNLSNPEVQRLLGVTAVGTAYALDIYHAERRTSGSNFGLTTSLVPGCTVLNSASASSTNTAAGAWITISAVFTEGSDLQLMDSGQTYLASYAFLAERIQIEAGFIAMFSFEMSAMQQAVFDGGFAFVMHHDPNGLSALNGGCGPNMGFSKNLVNSLAVSFNFTQESPVAALLVNGDILVSSPLLAPTNVEDGKPHLVEIRYYGSNPPWFDVYLDNDLILQKRNISLVADVFGSSSAYLGFTSGSGAQTSPGIKVSNVSVSTVSVEDGNTQVRQVKAQALADGSDVCQIVISTRDSCGNNLTFGGQANLISLDLIDNSTASGSDLSISWLVRDNSDGNYDILIWSTQIATLIPIVRFGNVTFDNLAPIVFEHPPPLHTVSPTIAPELHGSSNVLVYVGIAFGTVCAAGACLIALGCFARWKWRTQKKFISPGKTVVAERNVTYYADLELSIMQSKVQRSFEEINRERSRARIMNPDRIIVELNAEIQKLHTEIRRLKEARHLRRTLEEQPCMAASGVGFRLQKSDGIPGDANGVIVPQTASKQTKKDFGRQMVLV